MQVQYYCLQVYLKNRIFLEYFQISQSVPISMKGFSPNVIYLIFELIWKIQSIILHLVNIRTDRETWQYDNFYLEL